MRTPHTLLRPQVLLLFLLLLLPAALLVLADQHASLQEPPFAPAVPDAGDRRAAQQQQQQQPLQPQPDETSPSSWKRGDPPAPGYTPVATPPPGQDAALASLGYKQETYYTCNSVGGREHCGWHVPIVKAQGVRRDSGTVVAVVACLAGVFALGLM
ncbi:uncharacterized protein UV8b_07673 [Ustilaginoidea virens]|uniref:Uncharacterized protein n=1 Tax=Ustilaginoidea virens TaxID=1159556 RepID=A0A8E5MKR3_USTVR|nr:uncharacterized protein UV8b_07673 [Ustilaginoidea virens]QUC23432.1 hypothetical protein UV8b_07673 [Ustilaginoidea virens]